MCLLLLCDCGLLFDDSAQGGASPIAREVAEEAGSTSPAAPTEPADAVSARGEDDAPAPQLPDPGENPEPISREATEDESISPVFECSVSLDNGAFAAWFGYDNRTEALLHLPEDARNFIHIDGLGQTPVEALPRVFQAGRQRHDFFVVSSTGSNVQWHLRTRSATASASAQQCNATERERVLATLDALEP